MPGTIETVGVASDALIQRTSVLWGRLKENYQLTYN